MTSGEASRKAVETLAERLDLYAIVTHDAEGAARTRLEMGRNARPLPGSFLPDLRRQLRTVGLGIGEHDLRPNDGTFSGEVDQLDPEGGQQLAQAKPGGTEGHATH